MTLISLRVEGASELVGAAEFAFALFRSVSNAAGVFLGCGSFTWSTWLLSFGSCNLVELLAWLIISYCFKGMLFSPPWPLCGQLLKFLL